MRTITWFSKLRYSSELVWLCSNCRLSGYVFSYYSEKRLSISSFQTKLFFHSSYNSWWRLPTRIFFPSSASDVSHFSLHHNLAEEVATLNLLQPLLNGWLEIVVLYRNICDIKVTKHDELKWALIFRIFS